MSRKKVHARTSDKKVAAIPTAPVEIEVESLSEGVELPEIEGRSSTLPTIPTLDGLFVDAKEVEISLEPTPAVEEVITETELTFTKVEEDTKYFKEKLAQASSPAIWIDLHPALVFVLNGIYSRTRDEEITFNYALKALSVKKVEDVGSAFGSSNKRATIVDIINSTGLAFSAEFKAAARLLAI